MPVNVIPTPPDFQDFAGLNFVARAAMFGCVPDLWLALQFAKEPATELAGLLFLPDAFDIGQAIFEPRKNRSTRPNRHGRKGRSSLGFPDVSDLIGKMLREYVNPNDILRGPNATIMFRALNIYEGINFAVALADISEDIVINAFYGPLMFDERNCTEFSRFERLNLNDATFTGSGPPANIINMGDLVSSVNFDTTPLLIGTNPFKCIISHQAPQIRLISGAAGSIQGIILAGDGEELGRGPVVPLAAGSTASAYVTAAVPPNRGASLYWELDGGIAVSTGARTIGFEAAGVPWLDD